MNSKVDTSHYVLSTNVLGPYRRSALWVHGCCFDCDGCIAKEMNLQASNYIDVQELVTIFAGNEDTEGITISGGEPFLQATALADLIEGIKKERDYGVIVYTGFLMDELKVKADKEIERLLSKIDIIIEGRYQKELDDGLPYRGSSNQRIVLLTDRYRDVYEQYYFSSKKRDIEIKLDEGHAYLIGVPSELGLKTWRELKKRAEGNGERI